jgi:hypothetical protein
MPNMMLDLLDDGFSIDHDAREVIGRGKAGRKAMANASGPNQRHHANSPAQQRSYLPDWHL